MAKVTPVSVGGMEFDALIEDSRSMTNDVPSYPIEDGFEINDSIIHKPEELSLTLLITHASLTHSGGKSWVNSAVKKIEALYFESTPVTVKTPDKTFEDMAITSISISPYNGNGYAKQIEISLQKIETVSSKKTTIPDSYGKSGESGANAGTASTSTSATPASTSSSSSSTSTSGTNQSSGSMAYNLASQAGLF